MRKAVLSVLAVLALGAPAPAGADTTVQLRPAGELYVLSAAECAAFTSASPAFGAACAARETADPAAVRAVAAACTLSAQVLYTQGLTLNLYLGSVYGQIDCDAPLRPLACAVASVDVVGAPPVNAYANLGSGQRCGAATFMVAFYGSTHLALVAGVVDGLPAAQAFIITG